MRCVASAAALLAAAHPAHAQLSAGQRALDLAVNGAIGAARGVAAAIVAHRSLWRAALIGFSGGAVVGVAKQWTGGAGGDLTGVGARALAGLGESVTLAAATDTLRLLLPVSPVLIEIEPASRRDRVRLRLDVAQAVRLGYAVTRPGFSLDARASLRAGAPVVRTRAPYLDDASSVEAMTSRGVVLLAAGEVQSPAATERRLAHESIHIIQQDQADLLIGLDIEDAMLRRWVPAGERISRWAVPGVVGGLASRLVQSFYSYSASPWEREAFRFGTAGSLSSGSRSPQ